MIARVIKFLISKLLLPVYLCLLDPITKELKKKYTFIQGARGSAKTFTATLIIIHYLLTGRSVLVLRQKSKDNRTSTFSEIKYRLGEWMLPFRQWKGVLQLRVGKSVVVFGGMSDESDFKSMRPDDANQIGLIWFEEASHILPNATRQEAIEATEEIINSFGRSKNDTGIKVLFTYNPPSPTHWLADKYHNREQLLDDEQLIVTTQEDNPHLTEEYKRSFDKWKVIWPEYWAQQVEGKMLETGLKCYPTVMQNVVPRVETSINRICIGVDLGIDDATTFVATAMNSDYSNMVVVACYEHSNHGIRNNDLRKDFTDYANDFVNFYNSLKITYPGVIIEIYIDSETRGEMFRKLLKKRQIFGKLIVKNKIEERIIKTNILLRNGNLKLIQSLPIVNALANATRNTESTNKDDWIRVQNRETHLIDAFEYSIISKLNHIKILEGE